MPKFGFLAITIAVIALLGAAVGVKMLSKSAKDKPPVVAANGAPKSAGNGGPPSGGGELVPVTVATPVLHEFADEVTAVGTAQARESIVVSSKVTDVIASIKFRSGNAVGRGDILITLSSVEQKADLAEARAALIAAESDLNRSVVLVEKGVATTARLEQSRAAYGQAKARVDALEARIEDRVIRAPFSGVVGLRQASVGQLVRPGDELATLDDVSVIKLDFEVPEAQSSRVVPGTRIEARSAAWPAIVFTGKVAEIDSRVNTATRGIMTRTYIDNREMRLKPGMLLTVKVFPGAEKVLSVPDVALLETAEGTSLFTVVANPDGGLMAKKVPVTIGRRSDGFAEIVDGLKPTQDIVIEGVNRVRPKSVVKVVGRAPLTPPPSARAAAAEPAPKPMPNKG